jgi:hypothetical protein
VHSSLSPRVDFVVFKGCILKFSIPAITFGGCKAAGTTSIGSPLGKEYWRCAGALLSHAPISFPCCFLLIRVLNFAKNGQIAISPHRRAMALVLEVWPFANHA